MAVNEVSSLGGPLSMEIVLDDSSVGQTRAEIEKELQALAEASIQASEKQAASLAGVVKAYELIRKTGLEGGDEILNLLKAEAKAAEDLGTGFDQSKQELIDYLEAVKQLSKEGITNAGTTAPTTAPAPAAGVDQSLKQLIDESQRAFDELDEQTRNYILDLIKVQQQLNEVTNAQSKLDAEYKKGNISIADYDKANLGLTVKTRDLTEDLTKLTDNHKKYEAIQNQATGSINQKKILLQQLQQQYDALSEAERNSAENGGAIQKSIQDIESEIRKLTGDIDESKTAFQRLREIKTQLVDLKPGDEGFNELLNEANKLQNKINDVNDALRLTGSTTSKIDAMTQSVRGVVGGFAAWQGVLGVFNTSNKDVEKNIQLLVSTMAILNGVQEVSAILDKNSALNTFLLSQARKSTAAATVEQAVATEAVAAAETAEAVAATSATAATEGLNVAMAANPAGAVLLLITGVIVALQAFISTMSDATEEQTALNNAVAEGNDLLQKVVDLQAATATERTRQAERAVALAQAQGKSESEITKLRIDALNATIRENTIKASSFGIDRQSHEQNKIALERRLEEEQALLRLKKVDEDRLGIVKSQVAELQSLVNAGNSYFNAIDGANTKIQEEIAAKNKKAKDDELKSQADSAAARLVIVKKGTEAELKAKIDSINAQRRLELNDANITKGTIERINAEADRQITEAKTEFKITLLQNQRELLQARLASAKEGSAEELAIRTDMINKTAEIELAALNISEEKKAKVIEEKQKAIRDLVEKRNLQQAEADKNAEIARINTQLANVQAGSEEELRLRKELIDKQGDLETIKIEQSVKNEQLKNAKVLEIVAAGLAKQKKLEDDFADKSLKSRLKIIQDNTDRLNLNLQDLADNGNINQRFRARTFQLTNEQDGLERQLREVNAAIQSGTGDYQKLTAESSRLQKQLEGVREALRLLGIQFKKDTEKVITDGFRKIGGSFSSLSSSLAGFDTDISDIIGKLSEMASTSGDAISGLFDAFKTGGIEGIAGGVSSAISLIASAIGGIARDRQERLQNEAEARQFQQDIYSGEQEINILYRERAREQVRINTLRLEGLQQEHDLLIAQAGDIKKQYEKVFSDLQHSTGEILKQETNPFAPGGVENVTEQFSLLGKTFQELEELSIKGLLSKEAQGLFDLAKKLRTELEDVEKLTRENEQERIENLTATTSTSITDSIVDGFRNGKIAVEDFADTFEDLMRDAMLNSLKLNLIQPEIEKFQKQFADAMESGGVLDEEENKKLKELFDSITQLALDRQEEIEKITGISLNKMNESDNSLAGSIQKSLTEQTGTVIAGQFNGLRLTAIEQLRVAKQQLEIAVLIKGDTSFLPKMYQTFRNLEDNGFKIKG